MPSRREVIVAAALQCDHRERRKRRRQAKIAQHRRNTAGIDDLCAVPDPVTHERHGRAPVEHRDQQVSGRIGGIGRDLDEDLQRVINEKRRKGRKGRAAEQASERVRITLARTPECDGFTRLVKQVQPELCRAHGARDQPALFSIEVDSQSPCEVLPE